MLLRLALALAAAVAVACPLGAAGVTPSWPPTYNMSQSTILMPCNYSGFTDPLIADRWGIVDFDWSNAKGMWTKQHPMDCQERLVKQAQLVKSVSPDTKVWVYRNLVKALPWYTDVREKILDPAYAGFFLKFTPGGAFPNGSYHVPQCTASQSGGPTKCSAFYHDQEQTPRTTSGPSSDPNTCDGDCDCGEGLPCGEYLWDHRNGTMLREYLINEFVLGAKTGLGNPNVDGFFFDDGWTNHPSKIPPWAPPSYHQCNMWKTGGATEEDYYCVVDMGLSQDDVNAITSNHSATMTAVYDAVVKNNGFAWPLLTQRAASLDLADPRPPKTCNAYMQRYCKPTNPYLNETLAFGLTRKTFHDPFPLPFPEVDVAQFLLVRGPYAYIGHSWMGCLQAYERPPELDHDYGEPLEPTCRETAAGSGIYERKWSKYTIQMDCNKHSATFTPK